MSPLFFFIAFITSGNTGTICGFLYYWCPSVKLGNEPALFLNPLPVHSAESGIQNRCQFLCGMQVWPWVIGLCVLISSFAESLWLVCHGTDLIEPSQSLPWFLSCVNNTFVSKVNYWQIESRVIGHFGVSGGLFHLLGLLLSYLFLRWTNLNFFHVIFKGLYFIFYFLALKYENWGWNLNFELVPRLPPTMSFQVKFL